MEALQRWVLRHQRSLTWLLAVFCLLIPSLVHNSYYIHVLILVLLYSILALGLNLIVGLVGLLNLGYAAFYGVGAYTCALLTVKLGFSFWLALPLAVLVTAGAGVALGMPSLRLRGDYLAIVTLGFGEIFRLVARNWDDLTNGPKGISGIAAPVLGSFRFSQESHYYYLALLFTAFAVFFQARLSDSRVGRAWIAIREDEIAAESLGINTTNYKLLAFGLSSAFAGLAGAFFAGWQGFISPESFNFLESVTILSMVVIGGMGSIAGSILGAAFLVIVPEALRGSAEWRSLFLGGAMVVTMLFRPQGLLGSWRRAHELAPETERIKDEEDESLFETRKK